MRYLVLYSVLLAMLFAAVSCKQGSTAIPVVKFEFDTIPLKQKISKALEYEYLDALGFNNEEKNYLKAIYSENQNKSFWINDSSLSLQGQKLKSQIENKLMYGVASCRVYPGIDSQDNFIQKELKLSIRLAYFLNDVKNGFLDVDSVRIKPLSLINPVDFKKFSASQDIIKERIFSFTPQDTSFQFLSQQLFNFLESYPLDTANYNMKSIKEDSIQTMLLAKEALHSKGYLKHDTLFIDALKKFQYHNGLKQDAVIGKYTAKALNESTYKKVHRVILAMEKQRHRKAFPSKYILINLPEYELRYFANDSLKNEHRIVIGKIETNTPKLYSKVRSIVVFPYWNVPYSIASKEILPSIKRNVKYLEKNNYKIFKNGDEIDPYSIDWSKYTEKNFPFKIRQEPGPSNSLGVLKFEFHNTYSVYVHDTPSKSLFSVDVRSFSHGCIRCENPAMLAKTILDYDFKNTKVNKFTGDSLDSILELKEHYQISLVDPVPIYIDYVSVVANKNELITYIDIYDQDKDFVKILMN